LRRRDLIALFGAAAGWPLAARGQPAANPVIGFLNGASSDLSAHLVRPFHEGLGEAGFVDGRNVTIEFRWANGQYDRLPALAADLVRRQVTVIAATSTPTGLPAKAATSTIPIVFVTGSDPVELGLVASMNRPGGNLTGVTTLAVELGQKRMELLHELVPKATLIAALVNPTGPNLETVLRDLRGAARTLGLPLHILHASSERDFDTVFANLAQLRAGALVIGTDTFFNSRSPQIAALTVRHAVPAIYQYREFAAAGGLLSYAGSITDAYRLAGVYTGRVLKGEKPADLPVQRSTKAELFVNRKTAKRLGITIPQSILLRADEVID
jgi:putative tryptophan/tyrosine transport system substrate-binding protein